MLLNAIITVINFLISGAGSFFTWKSYKDTKAAREDAKEAASETRLAKEETMHALDSYSLFVSQHELYAKLQNCNSIVRSEQISISHNVEFSSDFSFVITLLGRLLDPDGKDAALLLDVKKKYEIIKRQDKDINVNRSEYAALIGSIWVILKTGRA